MSFNAKLIESLMTLAGGIFKGDRILFPTEDSYIYGFKKVRQFDCQYYLP